ncbi:hypothetical protein CYMTET_50351 [Cymbomonas tetramitiformis]|uniref:Uncharacterized protein n=2 Tax=Cymbomonas tetramitiformis TaxID=36881 RepID=A0AAE0BN80_9CHLO|nr:hypothetical protein CYMTET_50351 [Cymbomonas tetramitiformis]
MGTLFYGMDSFKKSYDAICRSVSSPGVAGYVRGNRSQRATPESATLLEQFQEVRGILVDLYFPAQIDLCLAFLQPVVLLLRFSDSDLPTASKIQYHKFEVQEALKAVAIDPENPPWDMDAEEAPSPEALKQEIISIHRYRWDYGYTILQGTGYLLDPEYIDMDQHEDEETMESFRRFVEKTYYYPKPPGPDASAEEVAAFKVQCASQLAKRSAAEVQLLQYKMKRGVFARETVWEIAKVVSTPDFWFLFGSSVKELQLVGMRATAQVSGAGAAERGHKVMNLVENKARNRMHWDNVESWMYIIHNSKQIEKRTSIEYDPEVISWTEGNEENVAWRDAWEPEEDDARQRQRMVAAETRASNIARGATRRVRPLTDEQVAASAEATTTASGRIVRRPAVLTL